MLNEQKLKYRIENNSIKVETGTNELGLLGRTHEQQNTQQEAHCLEEEQNIKLNETEAIHEHIGR